VSQSRFARERHSQEVIVVIIMVADIAVSSVIITIVQFIVIVMVAPGDAAVGISGRVLSAA
jgi:hypothetical protein